MVRRALGLSALMVSGLLMSPLETRDSKLATGVQDRGASIDVLFAPTGDRRLVQKRIGDEIGAARKEILVAIYQFTSKDLARDLANARRRGVDVRILIDEDQADDKLVKEALETIHNAKIPVRRVDPAGVNSGRSGARRPKFHHKYCVIDGKLLITGSFNWTVLADEENHENIVLISHQKVASQYAEKFKEVWENEKIARE